MTAPSFTKDYAGLCATVADTLNRQDLAAIVPNFVQLATARLNRVLAEVRHPSMVAHDTATATSAFLPVPGNFSAPYILQIAGQTLEYVSPDEAKRLSEAGISGQTRYWTLLGTDFWLLPAPTVAAPVSLDRYFYQTLPDLSDSATTNWALKRYPDLYLYAALGHSAPYLGADERLQTWESAFQAILNEIRTEAERAARPQGTPIARGRNF